MTTYDAEVVHRRTHPEHVVRQRLRLDWLDVDDLPPRFRRRDYLDGTDRPFREALADVVGRPVDGPVHVLTQRRSLGWLFNPLTTYYLADGTRVLEVSNTPWHERHWYVVDGDEATFAKAFHVSPFLPMDLTYRCEAPEPGGHLSLRLELRRGDTTVLDVALTGRRSQTRPSRLQTLQVSTGIYGHALALRLRGATFHGHP